MSQARHELSDFALPAGALLAASLLLGCAAHDPAATRTVASSTPPPSTLRNASVLRPEDAFADAGSTRVGSFGAESPAESLRARLDEAWEQGQARWLAGEPEAALDSFDAGLEAVAASGLELAAHPHLARRVEDLNAGIRGLAAAGQRGDSTPFIEERRLPELPDLPASELAHQSVVWHEPVSSQAVQAGHSVPDWLLDSTGPYTIPMKDHPTVDAMVRFYSQERREHLETGFRRAGLYGPTVARILREEGVPGDLMWLAIVESNYNAQAYSRARAKGLWQFIPATGRRYGLEQDFWLDERADFEKATRSSARYLKDLHERFGDWHLAIAAYNAGEGKVGRGIARTGVRDYWHLRSTSNLRRETKSYVPALLAVMRIARDPAGHGVDFSPAEPLQWEVATVNACADLSVLAGCADTDVETLKQLNPELRRGCTPGDTKCYALRVPAGKNEEFARRFAQLPPEKRLSWARHRVNRGETLSSIAGRYGSSVSGIMAANKLRSANRIGVGWTLLIPRGDTAGSLPGHAVAANAPSGSRTRTASASTTASYRVRSGDTLVAIAKRHGTSVSKLSSLNGLRNANRIRPGQRLLITSPAKPAPRASGAPTHTVRRGDTLIGIAKANGATVAQLREWNRLPARGYIHPGQKLVVKGGTTYAVRRGDTLSHIARRFRTNVAQLREWNDLNRSGLIRPGDRLTIFTN